METGIYEPLTPESYGRIVIDGTWRYGFNEVAEMLGPLHGKRALDYGCGTGRSTRFLSELGADVVGTDSNPRMIEVAQRQNQALEYRLIQDGLIPESDGSFDAALSGFVHLEISARDEMCRVDREVCRVLKPRGIYVVLTANPEMWGHQYESFSSSFPPDFAGRGGQKINVQIRTGTGTIEFVDYYWEEADYTRSLETAGFAVEEAKKVVAGEKEAPPPFLVIRAAKR